MTLDIPEGLPAWTPDVALVEVAVLWMSGIEGIVWHHPDGRMAKLKGRDIEDTGAAA